MAGIRDKLGQLGGDVKNLGGNAATAGQKLFGSAESAGKAGKGLIGGAVTLLKQPVKWGIDGARMVVNTGNYALRHHPRFTIAAAALGTAIGVGSLMRNGAAKKTNDQLEANAAAMQQSYMNSVSPQEAAMLDARQRSGGSAGFAEMQAARAADAQAAR